jgi:hypothetical protein
VVISFVGQAVDTLIGDINPPAQLMQTHPGRKIAEVQRSRWGRTLFV